MGMGFAMKKQSINRIFGQILVAATLLSVMLGLVSVMMLAEHKSAREISLLRQMKQEASRSRTINPHDVTLAKIAFSRVRAQLILNKEQFDGSSAAFDPMSLVFPQTRDSRSAEMLQHKLEDFFVHAEQFFELGREKQNAESLETAYSHLMEHLHAMSDHAVAQEHEVAKMRQAIIFTLFVLSLLLLLFIRQRQRLISVDLQSLYGIKTSGYQFRMAEVEAIAARIKQANIEKEHQNLIDPLAQIKNYKGVIHAFSTSKTINRNNALCICIFEIDHYTELEKLYSQSFVEGLFRKIASMLSLHEAHHEIVGVMEASKFIFILARNSKQEALKECEAFKDSVAIAHFKTPEGVPIKITLSGGFVQKMSHKSIDTVVLYAIEILKKVQETGINRIAQLKENAEKL